MLNIITACSRPENLQKMYESVKPFVKDNNIKWWICYDGNKLTQDKDYNVEEQFDESWINESTYHCAGCGVGYPQRNFILGQITDSVFYKDKEGSEHCDENWIWEMDDDNIMHPDFYPEISKLLESEYGAIIFNQQLKDKIRIGEPDSVKVTHIDMAQYVVKKSFIGDIKYICLSCSDGMFIEKFFNAHPEKFVFINKTLCYYNFLRPNA